jgi:pimeloyl-ACP methyl ester carboxylesterase
MPSGPVHHRVPVIGGELFVGVWPGLRVDAPIVIAIHGGTSSHRIWFAVAEALAGRATLVAPDYRGANGSERLGPPYGLRAHADDVRRVADHFEAARVVLAGWSLGGFIAASAARALGERAQGTVLVDGGVPLALPADFDLAALQDALIEPAMRRYRMTFERRAEHRAVWRAHPALQDPSLWRPELEEAIDDELEEANGRLRFRVDLESLRTDVLDTLRAEGREAVTRLRTPTTFVWAERGLEDEPVGYYPRAAARDFAKTHGLRLAEGDGLNHYALMLAPRGARLVADEIARRC